MDVVSRARDRDRDAFETLVDRHASEVYRLVAAIVGSADAADTRRDLDDGGQLWTMEGSPDRGTWVSEWHVGPDGALLSWASEGTGMTMYPGEDFGTGSRRFVMEFTSIEDADPIRAPEGRTPEVAAAEYGLPADFPLEPG